ncbi:MAG: hypothetical protein KF781_04480 [Chitinophagaceae bacterium]|nr:hypothetical protein [Chitinophagaceae bacterium]MCW5904660.1 hypothetical protein [Chitinophagaceae bacterium]
MLVTNVILLAIAVHAIKKSAVWVEGTSFKFDCILIIFMTFSGNVVKNGW